MYKKYIELKTGGRIWIKPIDDGNNEIQFQIKFQDKKGDVVLESNLLEKRAALKIIELLINKNDIEDFIESDY